MKKFVSQAEFARMNGVSAPRVSQWVRDGLITLTWDRKVNVEVASLQLKQRLDLGKRIDWEAAFNKKISPKREEDEIKCQKKIQRK